MAPHTCHSLQPGQDCTIVPWDSLTITCPYPTITGLPPHWILPHVPSYGLAMSAYIPSHISFFLLHWFYVPPVVADSPLCLFAAQHYIVATRAPPPVRCHPPHAFLAAPLRVHAYTRAFNTRPRIWRCPPVYSAVPDPVIHYRCLSTYTTAGVWRCLPLRLLTCLRVHARLPFVFALLPFCHSVPPHRAIHATRWLQLVVGLFCCTWVQI